VINPAPYGLTNVKDMACDMTVPIQAAATATPPGFGASSLVCNSSNVIPGVTVDHYLFADGVHPTPYGYWLLARYVAKEMLVKGWL
jgi:phospholipase/lecithinase/hemolysin